MDEQDYKLEKYLKEEWDEEEKQHYDKMEKEVKNQMGTIREEAIAYEPKQTLNIADLDKVSIDELTLLQSEEKPGKDGNPFTYKYFVLDEKEYRVPITVIEEIQKMLKLKPELKFVKVIKTGTGQYNTKYAVEEYKEPPIDAPLQI